MRYIYHHYHYFRDEETEQQGGWAMYPWSPNQEDTELE